MDGAVELYVKKRIEELGITNYHVDSGKKKLAAGEVLNIQAQNEYWYLFDVSPLGNFQIEASTEIVDQNKFFTDGAPYRFIELHGEIRIRNRSVADQSYTYYRIIVE